MPGRGFILMPIFYSEGYSTPSIADGMKQLMDSAGTRCQACLCKPSMTHGGTATMEDVRVSFKGSALPSGTNRADRVTPCFHNRGSGRNRLRREQAALFRGRGSGGIQLPSCQRGADRPWPTSSLSREAAAVGGSCFPLGLAQQNLGGLTMAGRRGSRGAPWVQCGQAEPFRLLTAKLKSLIAA
ncbi:hypothetical protein VUR80DRAFT_6636 [Thermomyces stellatus]